jgi:hypothetical protein
LSNRFRLLIMVPLDKCNQQRLLLERVHMSELPESNETNGISSSSSIELHKLRLAALRSLAKDKLHNEREDGELSDEVRLSERVTKEDDEFRDLIKEYVSQPISHSESSTNGTTFLLPRHLV